MSDSILNTKEALEQLQQSPLSYRNRAISAVHVPLLLIEDVSVHVGLFGMKTCTLPHCLIRKFARVAVLLLDRLGCAQSSTLGCSRPPPPPLAIHRKLLQISETQRRRTQEGRAREKPQMQMRPCQCISALACKALHSCWCSLPLAVTNSTRMCAEQNTHNHYSYRCLLSELISWWTSVFLVPE